MVKHGWKEGHFKTRMLRSWYPGKVWAKVPRLAARRTWQESERRCPLSVEDRLVFAVLADATGLLPENWST